MLSEINTLACKSKGPLPSCWLVPMLIIHAGSSVLCSGWSNVGLLISSKIKVITSKFHLLLVPVKSCFTSKKIVKNG